MSRGHAAILDDERVNKWSNGDDDNPEFVVGEGLQEEKPCLPFPPPIPTGSAFKEWPTCAQNIIIPLFICRHNNL